MTAALERRTETIRRPARRCIENDRVVHRCAACNHVLGTEPLPPLSKRSEGGPLEVKCHCNALNLVIVGVCGSRY